MPDTVPQALALDCPENVIRHPAFAPGQKQGQALRARQAGICSQQHRQVLTRFQRTNKEPKAGGQTLARGKLLDRRGGQRPEDRSVVTKRRHIDIVRIYAEQPGKISTRAVADRQDAQRPATSQSRKIAQVPTPCGAQSSGKKQKTKVVYGDYHGRLQIERGDKCHGMIKVELAQLPGLKNLLP